MTVKSDTKPAEETTATDKALLKLLAEMQAEIKELKAGPRLPIATHSKEARLSIGEMQSKQRGYTNPQAKWSGVPAFDTGNLVRVKETTTRGAAFRAYLLKNHAIGDADPLPVGEVLGIKGIFNGEPKYNVRFGGIGKDGVPESELEAV